MENTTKKRDRNVNLRLTDYAHDALAALREYSGLKNTGIVELAVREKAERDLPLVLKEKLRETRKD